MTTAIQTTQANPFEPSNMSEAMTLATTIAKSGIIPDALRNKPSDVLIILMTGRELGIGPMQAMRGISVVKGRPVLSADLMVAQCLRHRDVCEFFRLVESSATVARYQTKRAGSEPVDLAWTMQDAERAGLAGGQNWRNHPAAMLRARCSAALARAVYPDLVGGIYEESEGEEIAGKGKAPVVSIAPPPPAPAPVEEPVVEAKVVEVAPRGGDPKPVAEVVAAMAPTAEPNLTTGEVWDALVAKLGEGDAAIEWRQLKARLNLPAKNSDLTQAHLSAMAQAIAALDKIDF